MQNWRARLTPLQQRIYDRSASIPAIQLPPSSQLLEATAVLGEALAREDRARVESLSQTIVNHICWQLNVRTVRVQVEGVRPSNRRGELHGLYTQYSGGSTSIQVWMRTAKRGQVVAFRTFLRTLLHEVCHHLDYTYLHLRESYHTDGFFQRESGLFRTIVQQPAEEEARKPGQSLSEMVSEILAARGRTDGEKGDAKEKDGQK
ncbi:MAG TPA: hypothetical protein VGX03_21635 [Candidatus Binatia bacterium]|jgi:hypothetical protein|nr:hypothetical protein [Candidatus Binatia bacterium]